MSLSFPYILRDFNRAPVINVIAVAAAFGRAGQARRSNPARYMSLKVKFSHTFSELLSAICPTFPQKIYLKEFSFICLSLIRRTIIVSIILTRITPTTNIKTSITTTVRQYDVRLLSFVL